MGLIGAGTFISVVNNYRLLWISGKFGGGKTSLAFKLSETWLQRGYRLLTNGRCVWADKPEDVDFIDDFGHLKTIVVLDESGLEFKATKQVEMIAAYAAKMDIIFMLPSFWAPVRTAQVVTCQPLFGFQLIGLPLIVYRWKVKLGGFEDGGTFFWWQPAEIYGVYSRQDPGDIAAEIIDFLVEKAEQFRARYGRAKNSLSALEVGAEDLLYDAAGQIAEAADALSLAGRKRGRRRR